MKRRTIIGDRFELLAPIGRGGMATVHRARDRHLGREVAIKLMRPHLGEDPVFMARFENEARRAASIAHPNVIGIYDFSTDGAAPYIAMELVEGTDLARLIRAGGPLAPSRAAGIGAQIAAALSAAHALGIVHRDVKPSNVLIGDDGRVRVADFGVAHVRGEDSMTSTGATLGSVEYFSPEQARGEEATPASDIYTLGIVLYEMLTGQRPFRGDSPYATAVQRLDAAAPDPRRLVGNIPASFAAVVMRAMAPDASDRFASADELHAALLPLAVEPVVGRTDADRAPAPVPVARRPRRRRLAALPLAVAALLGLAVVGAVGAGLLARLGGNPVTMDENTVTLGDPVGFLISEEPTASPTPRPTPDPTLTPMPTPAATPEPTPIPVPTPELTPLPAVPAPPPVQAAPPAVVASAIDSPADSVATWYAYVENGQFDEAYGLWSPRMQGNFPRQGNLDGRWANTANVAVHELSVAEQTATTAKVQISFTESYDAGGSRQFVGWWDLVLIDGRWYLDNPNF